MWEEGINLVKEIEAYDMDLSARYRYAAWRRDGKLQSLHAERIDIVDRAIHKMMSSHKQ